MLNRGQIALTFLKFITALFIASSSAQAASNDILPTHLGFHLSRIQVQNYKNSSLVPVANWGVGGSLDMHYGTGAARLRVSFELSWVPTVVSAAEFSTKPRWDIPAVINFVPHFKLGKKMYLGAGIGFGGMTSDPPSSAGDPPTPGSEEENNLFEMLAEATSIQVSGVIGLRLGSLSLEIRPTRLFHDRRNANEIIWYASAGMVFGPISWH